MGLFSGGHRLAFKFFWENLIFGLRQQPTGLVSGFSQPTHNNMKKIASLILSAALASTAFAGPATSGKGGKMVTPPAPSCTWFDPGLKLGVFGGGFIPIDDDFNGGDALGGGVLAEYFFCKNFGIEVGYGAYATDSTEHLFDASLVARYPIESLCIAPYLLVGGGLTTNGSTDGNYHVGGGIEAHLTNNMGIFADGKYHFEENDKSDFVLVRVGLKFRL